MTSVACAEGHGDERARHPTTGMVVRADVHDPTEAYEVRLSREYVGTEWALDPLAEDPRRVWGCGF